MPARHQTKAYADNPELCPANTHRMPHHGTCEDQLRNPKTAEVCFSNSHPGCNSPSSTKSDPEPNRLLQCRLCRLATAQHHSVKKFNHVSTLMRDELQWLRIGVRIRFKLSIIWQTRSGHYQLTVTGRDCVHQNRLMFSCQEARLKWAIGHFRLLVHVPGTVFLKLFGKPYPFLLSKRS